MFKIEKFTGGIAATNGYALEAPEGWLLVDAPEGISEWVKERGIAVGALVLTHGHFDHVMDAARVREEHACPVIAYGPVTPELTLEILLEQAGLPGRIEPFPVDQCLGARGEFTCLGRHFDVLHLPGHSPDSLCFLPRAAGGENPVVLAGDVLFQGSIGRTDFPHSDHQLFLAGIRAKLFVLDDETVVYPGHGPPTTIGKERRSNPFVGDGA